MALKHKSPQALCNTAPGDLIDVSNSARPRITGGGPARVPARWPERRGGGGAGRPRGGAVAGGRRGGPNGGRGDGRFASGADRCRRADRIPDRSEVVGPLSARYGARGVSACPCSGRGGSVDTTTTQASIAAAVPRRKVGVRLVIS